MQCGQVCHERKGNHGINECRIEVAQVGNFHEIVAELGHLFADQAGDHVKTLSSESRYLRDAHFATKQV